MIIYILCFTIVKCLRDEWLKGNIPPTSDIMMAMKEGGVFSVFLLGHIRSEKYGNVWTVADVCVRFSRE